MDWEPAINLLIQIPLVGIFVWFVLEMDKRNKVSIEKRDLRYEASQEKRDTQYMRSLNAVANTLVAMKKAYEEHDKRVDIVIEALDDMRGRDAK